MLLKRTFYLSTLLFLIFNPVFCQKIFRDGYIIKNNGEILEGLVEYKNNQKIPSSCIFKRFDIAVKVPYKSNEIKAFGYINGRRYESRKIDGNNCFIEVLVSGNITLYCKGSKFFLEKRPSGLVELNTGSIDYSVNSEKNEFNNLNSFLKYITEGLIVNIKERINPKKDLVPIIAEYNKKSGNPFVVYNQEFSEIMLLSESLRSGVNRNRFGIYTGINLYSLKVKPWATNYVPEPIPEYTIAPGVTYERTISRRNDKLSLRTDLMFLKQTFYSYSEKTTSNYIYRDDAFFEFTGLRLPLLLQYSFTSHGIIPYLNAGVSYTFFINKNYLHIRETECLLYGHDILTNEYNDISFNAGEISGLLGAGLKIRIVNNIKLNFQGRIEFGQGIFENNDDSKSDVYKFNQYSFQPTFLVGITF